MTVHDFDEAVALTADPRHAGHFHGKTSAKYWNMVGPFGGTTAAVVLQSVLEHPDLRGAPIALTVNYAAAIEPGDFEIVATPARTNRSTQHWTVRIMQKDADGHPQINTTATAVTALRRDTWSVTDAPMPKVPPPSELTPYGRSLSGVAWFSQYDMRPVSGAIPGTWDGTGDHSETVVWLRDAQPRPLDFPALASMSDMFYPRVWLRRTRRVPAGTVSITTYFHGDAAQLAQVGTGHLLGRAVGQQFRNGYFDQSAQLWSEWGDLLATSNQIVYFKE